MRMLCSLLCQDVVKDALKEAGFHMMKVLGAGSFGMAVRITQGLRVRLLSCVAARVLDIPKLLNMHAHMQDLQLLLLLLLHARIHASAS